MTQLPLLISLLLLPVRNLNSNSSHLGVMSSGDALVTRLSTLLRDLPTLKAAVVVACAFSALLIACLLLRVFRSGKRLRKTRKYDIITTPAERVEMAPLNEEDDEDEDSTVFDIKYSYVTSQPWNRIHQLSLARTMTTAVEPQGELVFCLTHEHCGSGCWVPLVLAGAAADTDPPNPQHCRHCNKDRE
ncbi:Membrane protein FAM174B [Heterocephalus glaber]|uniref:Membrane protein FAM174B n=1 Tax=Heterocephalus glaber TaxID=10181 RepID=G5C6N2_HETGA|nr:Membrane protein FAM174B [Heterocephalus glaber]